MIVSKGSQMATLAHVSYSGPCVTLHLSNIPHEFIGLSDSKFFRNHLSANLTYGGRSTFLAKAGWVGKSVVEGDYQIMLLRSERIRL